MTIGKFRYPYLFPQTSDKYSMNANLDIIAKELYGKIQTRFNDIKIGDENATVLSKKEDIPRARFFEFEYKEDGAPLGTITITLDEDEGVVVQVSGDLVNDRNDTSRNGAYKFLRSFRQFAKDRLLNFDVQNIGKSNLDKRDYQYQAKRKELPVMAQEPIMENKMYGTNRISYQDLGEARLIVKHSQPINIDLPAGRTMHIEGIYIENAMGERFLYPVKHLNGARALAEHIKHGGTPYDNIGKHITSLSEELASLRKFKNYVNRQEQLSEAMSNVTIRVADRMDNIKETILKLQRSAYYEEFVESFEAQEEQMIPEEIQNDLIDRLTIRTFNEELKSVFPYIYKFIDESELPVVELNADDMLGQDDVDEDAGVEQFAGKSNEVFDPETAFESVLEKIVSEDKDELFSPNPGAKNRAVSELNDLLSGDLSGGEAGVLALKGIIDDPELIEKIEVLETDEEIRAELKDYILDKDPALLKVLSNLDRDEANLEPAEPTAPAPAEPAAAAEPMAEPMAEPPAADAGLPENPPPPAPVAEDTDLPFDPDPTPSKKVTPGKFGQGHSQAKHLAQKGLKGAIDKAKKAGATLDTKLSIGGKSMTLHDAIKECGMTAMECGFDEPEEPGLPAMLKYISGFYNKEEGNFPLGGQRIKIKVKKAFEDGEFGDAGDQDLMKVLKFIDMKDPSGDEHSNIVRLAGIKKNPDSPNFDVSALEDQMGQLTLQVNEAVAPSGSPDYQKGFQDGVASSTVSKPEVAPAVAQAQAASNTQAAAPVAAPAASDDPAPSATTTTTPKNRDTMTFGQAFADARKNKEQTFTWKGKNYGTQMGTQAQGSQATTQQPQTAYRDPDAKGQGGQNALWLNQKFPKAQIGQEYWVKGTRYERQADGWYRSFERSDWFGKAANKMASQLGYTGPADDKSVGAWVAKNRPAQAVATPASPEEIPQYSESKESVGYDEVQRLVSLVHHR